MLTTGKYKYIVYLGAHFRVESQAGNRLGTSDIPVVRYPLTGKISTPILRTIRNIVDLLIQSTLFILAASAEVK